MNAAKRKALEAAGWKLGDAADFLGMSDAERQLLDAGGRTRSGNSTPAGSPASFAEATRTDPQDQPVSKQLEDTSSVHDNRSTRSAGQRLGIGIVMSLTLFSVGCLCINFSLGMFLRPHERDMLQRQLCNLSNWLFQDESLLGLTILLSGLVSLGMSLIALVWSIVRAWKTYMNRLRQT